MKLEANVLGAGPDLVMLHGWALHCGLFDDIADALAQRFTVHFIDLPGHGHNADVAMPADIDDVARIVLDNAPSNAHWLGWSLGGMVAMAAAAGAPERVRRLVTVASTPKFVAAPGWPHAIGEDTLDTMAEELRDDFRRTVSGFLSLQVLGDEHAATLLRNLRGKVYAHGEPAVSSLENGLRILHDADLRARVRDLQMPLLALMGDRDRLAPVAAGNALADLVPQGRCTVIRRAAHAPFISHREDFLEHVFDFLGAEG